MPLSWNPMYILVKPFLHEITIIFTARKRSYGKVMFSEVFVCPRMGDPGGVSSWGVSSWGAILGGAMKGGFHERGALKGCHEGRECHEGTLLSGQQRERYRSYSNAFLFKNTVVPVTFSKNMHQFWLNPKELLARYY